MMQYDFPHQTRTHYMGIIINEINWLSNLLEDYLSSERMEAGWHVYHKTYVPLVELIRQVSEQWNMKSSHLIQVNSEAEDVFVYADQNRIAQVFNNLISNAIKYSPGKNLVDIDIQEEEEFMAVCVRDYGMGVPQNLYDRLFEKFYRVDHPKYRQITGTGLGLYITRKIVEDHGGQISVASVLGQGTMFKLTIPKPDSIE
jgi:signal transduction histidine kinase